MCDNGKYMKFRSFNDGYKFCGKASVCECARVAVSTKVKNDKLAYDASKKKQIQEKREKTNLEKYGVANTGQLDSAKKAHKEFYANQENVTSTLERHRRTLMEKYNVSNVREIPWVNEKIANTLYERYGVTNISKIPGVQDKIVASKKEKYDDDHLLRISFQRMSNKFSDVYGLKILIGESEYCGTNKEYDFECMTCECVFKKTPSNLRSFYCPNCNPSYGSMEQTQIFDFIRTFYDGPILINNRSVLKNMELDIYFPEKNFAIEYNGVYWHNDNVVEKNYHRNKYESCNNVNITLLSIFSSHWKKNRVIVENMLRHKLLSQYTRISARKCIIKELTQKESNEFFDANHILGGTISKYRYGLYHDGALVAAMLFANPRLGIGKGQGGIELSRYATSCSVIGGAGKLLSYAIKQISPKSIYSYSDNSFSNGDMYDKLGFKMVSEIGPQYWYVDPSTEEIFHRFNFRKSKLKKMGFDTSNMTEKEIMDILGYYRVWDCGRKKWELHL